MSSAADYARMQPRPDGRRVPCISTGRDPLARRSHAPATYAEQSTPEGEKRVPLRRLIVMAPIAREAPGARNGCHCLTDVHTMRAGGMQREATRTGRRGMRNGRGERSHSSKQLREGIVGPNVASLPGLRMPQRAELDEQSLLFR